METAVILVVVAWLAFVVILVCCRASSEPLEEFEDIPDVGTEDAETDTGRDEVSAYEVMDMEALKTTYVELLEAIDDALEDTEDARKRVTLLSRRASTESKIHGINRKINALSAR